MTDVHTLIKDLPMLSPEYLKHDIKDYSIINFVTLTKTNLYGLYMPDKTSIKQIFESFFDNYECKQYKLCDLTFSNDDIDDLTLFEKLTASQIGLNKFTKLNLTNKKCSQVKNNEDIEKNQEYYDNLIKKINEDRKEDFSKIKKFINIEQEKLEKSEKSEKERSIDEESLYMKARQNLSLKTIDTFVKSLTGKSVFIPTYPDMTVQDYKHILASKERIPSTEMRLIFSGKQIEDDNAPVKDYNVMDCSTLHMVLRLRGGMFHETSGRNGNYQNLRSCLFVIEEDIKDEPIVEEIDEEIDEETNEESEEESDEDCGGIECLGYDKGYYVYKDEPKEQEDEPKIYLEDID
jgi:hypothetical protein